MKKILCILLAVCMALTSICVIFAADSTQDSESLKFSVGSAEAKAGETVSIPISVKNVSTGFSACNFTVTYDSDLLTYKNHTPGIYNGTLIAGNPLNNGTPVVGKVNIAGMSIYNTTDSGVIITLNFDVNPSVKDVNINSAISLEVTTLAYNLPNYDQEDLKSTVENGSVLINKQNITTTTTTQTTTTTETTTETTTTTAATTTKDTTTAATTTAAATTTKDTTTAAATTTKDTTTAATTTAATTTAATTTTKDTTTETSTTTATTTTKDTTTETTTTTAATTPQHTRPTQSTTNANDTTTETTTKSSPSGSSSSGSSGSGSGGSRHRATTTTTQTTTEKATETTTETSKTKTDKTKEVDNNKNIITKEAIISIGSKTVTIGDKKYNMDAAAYIQSASQSAMVPIRFVALAILNGNIDNADTNNIVKWDAATKTATIVAGDDVISFTAGSPYMVINGKSQLTENNVKAEIKDGRMYIPFRALGTALGVKVDWEAETKTAIYKVQ